MVSNVANCGRLRYSLGHREHIYIWFLSTLLVNKTKFSNPCHAQYSSEGVKPSYFSCILNLVELYT